MENEVAINSRVRHLESLVHDLLDVQSSSSCAPKMDQRRSLEESLEFLNSKITGEPEKIKLDECDCLEEALSIYKAHDFDARKPLKVRFKNQPAVDTGGVLRHFFLIAMEQMLSSIDGLPQLFEGNAGHHLPVYNAGIVSSKLMELIGKMFAHSIALVGIGPGFFPPVIYKYLWSETFDDTLLVLEDATGKTRFIIDKINEATNEKLRDVCEDLEYQELVSEAGIVVALTVNNRDLIVQDLLSHDVFGKRKVLYDQIRSGLKELGVLDEISKYPDFYSIFFTPTELTPNAVLETLKFTPSDNHKVALFMKEYITGASARALEDFLIFTISSKVVLPTTSIEIEIDEKENGIQGSTCFNKLSISANISDFVFFKCCLNAAIDRKKKSFNVI